MLEAVRVREHVVLYVDEQPSDLSLFGLTFGEEFTVRTAPSAEEALEILKEEQIAVLLASQPLEAPPGLDLMETVKERFPFIVRLVVAPEGDREALGEAVERGMVYRVLQKPWRREEIRQSLRSAIDLYYLAGRVNDLHLRQLRNDRLSSLGFAAAGIAHDMRTPLTSLSTGMELIQRRLARLRGEGAPAEAVAGVEEVLGTCVQSVQRLRSLVESIKIHVREHPEESVPVDLNEVVDSTLYLCRNEILARAQLEVARNAAPQVRGNPSRLGQVILNLINNAVGAIEPGAKESNRIKVEIDEEGGAAVVRISDSGGGIPEGEQERVFEPFFSTRSDGTGLGLAVTREIVANHGGELQLQSRVGEGSTFTVVLPSA